MATYGSKFTYIYLISIKDRNIIKIGESNNPTERLKVLSQERKNLELVLVDYFWSHKDVERILHSSLQGYVIHGEWFSISVDEVNGLFQKTKEWSTEICKFIPQHQFIEETLPEDDEEEPPFDIDDDEEEETPASRLGSRLRNSRSKE